MKRLILSFFVVAIALLATQCASGAGKESKGAVVEITQAQFKELVSDYTLPEWSFNGQRPAIVDFSAVWCGPCQRLAPILDELAAEYGQQIDFYKVDVDACPELSAAYGVSSIPMVLFCPVDGTPQAVTGLYPKEELVKVIEYVILK